MASPKILFVVNVDWFFLSHRLALAHAAQKLGWEVFVTALDTGKGDKIQKEGFHFLPLDLSRKGINPFAEIKTILSLIRIYRQVQPNIVHHVTIKPIIYGSIAACFSGVKYIVNALTGLGYIFSSHQKAKFLRPLIKGLCTLVFRTKKNITVFQNRDDCELFVTSGIIAASQTRVIYGSGVDTTRFAFSLRPKEDPIVMLAGRMLWDKGIKEFLEAANIVRMQYPKIRFVLVGNPDNGNPASISQEMLESWNNQALVEWWGHCDNMVEVLSRASLVVLPTSYPEGVPKVLIEAASIGRALIATNVPGCREIVRPGINGLLIPPKNSSALAKAIISLFSSPDLLDQFGCAGREIVVNEFSEKLVIQQTLEVYKSLFNPS